LSEGKWLLVSLAPGAISEAGAALIGASLMYSIWSAIEGRVTLEPAKRRPIFLYVDELATLTNGLPFQFELIAERARGLGAGLTVALQTLGRIPEPTRSALLGNVATFIRFRSAIEAAAIARQLPGLTDSDIAALGRYETAARVGTGAAPLPDVTGQAASIRDNSAGAYGTAVPERIKPTTAISKSDDDSEERPVDRTRRHRS
jgi:hypothetical protein